LVNASIQLVLNKINIIKPLKDIRVSKVLNKLQLYTIDLKTTREKAILCF